MTQGVKVVYLANVGTRDVTLDGQPIEPPRQEGERIWRAWKQVQERLDAPILRPGLEHAIRVAGRVDRVVLFVSDQPETTPAVYRDRDTVYFGEILREWLPAHPALRGKIGEVLVQRLSGNPADYNITIPFFDTQITRLVPQDVTTVFVAPVGGADASNVGLWLAAVRHFGRCVEVVYVMPDGRVVNVPLARQLERDFRRQQARALLEHYDYAALARLLRDSPEWGATWLPLLAEALAARLHFDFSTAAARLQAAVDRATGENRIRLQRLQEIMAPGLEPGEPPRASSDEGDWERWLARQRWALAELFWNLHVKAEREEWVDFLGRVFRLEEALLRLVFEAQTHHSTEKFGDGFPDFTAWLEKHADARAFLAEQGVGEPLEPNRWVLFQVLRYWVERGGKGRELGPVYNVIKKVEQLGNLRNKSIMAHGWHGVGRKDIEDIGGGVEELLATLRRGLEAAGVDVGATHPYKECNEWIGRRLLRD